MNEEKTFVNIRNLISTALISAAILAPALASASTVTVGTSTTVGTSVVSGCISQWSNSSDSYQTDSLALSGSAQLVASEAGDVSLGHSSGLTAVNGTLQGDASLSITETSETGHDSSGSSFNGSETSTTATTGSSAYSSFSGE